MRSASADRTAASRSVIPTWCRRERGAAAMTERVLITGTGAVCASGMTPEAILADVLAGRSAIGPIARFDVSTWPVQRAAEVRDYNARTLVDDRKLHKFIRRTDFYGIYAGGRAVAAANIAAHRD